jgi:integrase
MGTLTVQILRRDELTKDTPLEVVIRSFFVGNYDIADRTKAFYKTNFDKFSDFLRDNLGREPIMSDVNRDYADAFLSELAVKPTPKYPKGSPFRARAAATSIKRLAGWLAEDGVYADKFGQSLLKHVKRAKVSNDVRQPLTDAEIDALKYAAGKSGERDYAMFVFLLGTGLRLNECRELLLADIDIQRGQVSIRPETSKFRKGRVVDFHPSVARELDKYLRNRSLRPDQSLFPTDEGGVLTIRGFGRIFERMRENSGVRRFHVHLLRHTWATRYPGDLLELKRQGGWSRWEQVERYKHGKAIKRENLYDPLDSKRAEVIEMRSRRTG